MNNGDATVETFSGNRLKSLQRPKRNLSLATFHSAWGPLVKSVVCNAFSKRPRWIPWLRKSIVLVNPLQFSNLKKASATHGSARTCLAWLMCSAVEKENTKLLWRYIGANCHLYSGSATPIVHWSVLEAFRMPNGIRRTQQSFWCEFMTVLCRFSFRMSASWFQLFVFSVRRTPASREDRYIRLCEARYRTRFVTVFDFRQSTLKRK